MWVAQGPPPQPRAAPLLVTSIGVKGLTSQLKFFSFGQIDQLVQESNQISTFDYFRVFLMYFW